MGWIYTRITKKYEGSYLTKEKIVMKKGHFKTYWAVFVQQYVHCVNQ